MAWVNSYPTACYSCNETYLTTVKSCWPQNISEQKYKIWLIQTWQPTARHAVILIQKKADCKTIPWFSVGRKNTLFFIQTCNEWGADWQLKATRESAVKKQFDTPYLNWQNMLVKYLIIICKRNEKKKHKLNTVCSFVWFLFGYDSVT